MTDSTKPATNIFDVLTAVPMQYFKQGFSLTVGDQTAVFAPNLAVETGPPAQTIPEPEMTGTGVIAAARAAAKANVAAKRAERAEALAVAEGREVATKTLPTGEIVTDYVEEQRRVREARQQPPQAVDVPPGELVVPRKNSSGWWALASVMMDLSKTHSTEDLLASVNKFSAKEVNRNVITTSLGRLVDSGWLARDGAGWKATPAGAEEIARRWQTVDTSTEVELAASEPAPEPCVPAGVVADAPASTGDVPAGPAPCAPVAPAELVAAGMGVVAAGQPAADTADVAVVADLGALAASATAVDQPGLLDAPTLPDAVDPSEADLQDLIASLTS